MVKIIQAVWLLIIADIYIYAKVDLNDPAVRKNIISQAVEVLPKKQADGTFLYYQPLAVSPYKGTGWIKVYYDDGRKIHTLSQIKDGIDEGFETTWYENGQKMSEGKCKDGKKDGMRTTWFKNGQKESEKFYAQNEKKGTCRHWFSNGNLKIIHHHHPESGKIYGLLRRWHENGQIMEESNWKDGKEDGLANIWYENGQKEAEVNVKDGKLQRAKKWKPNGEVCPITNVKDGNGVIVVYNLDGTEKERFTYRDGVTIETKEESNSQTDDVIPSDELDKILKNSIGESAQALPPPP